MAPASAPPAVLCLRPRRDFEEAGVAVPDGLDVTFVADELAVAAIPPGTAGLVLPSAGARLAEDLFAGLERLRLIQYTGAGVDRVPEAVVARLGSVVCNVPGASAPDVAAYVVITAGALLRRLPLGDALTKAGRYREARAELAPAAARGFRGVTVGVVGLGGIGREVARLFEALGSRVVWADPAVGETGGDSPGGWERLPLPELLRRADVLTVHVPLTAETRGLIGAAELAALPPGAVVVQASRGGVIAEAALVEALDAGQLGGVALDVYTQEPLPADAPLLEAARRHPDRVILTPHVAGVTRDAARELYQRAWANVHQVLVAGATPRDRVA